MKKSSYLPDLQGKAMTHIDSDDSICEIRRCPIQSECLLGRSNIMESIKVKIPSMALLFGIFVDREERLNEEISIPF